MTRRYCQRTAVKKLTLGMVSLLLGFGITAAQAAPKCAMRRLTLPTSVTLATASAQELVGGVSDLALQRQDLSTIPPFRTTLRRSLPALWKGRVAAGSATDVQYELIGNNGCQNCLSHSEKPKSRVLVTLEPLPVTITNNPNGGRKCRRISGGVNLVLDLSSVQYAGNYQGELVVTVTQL
jgi:hypothetical protein